MCIRDRAGMSGRHYNKGVLIISGYFRETFGQDQPLSFNANLVFEQSYGMVDGDSASCTEIFALLSTLSGLPIKQSIAVTGSLNQKGEVQPIGGVNEKIEGFFDICKMNGLTGKQGVVIPIQNVADLMLREDVVDAVGALQRGHLQVDGVVGHLVADAIDHHAVRDGFIELRPAELDLLGEDAAAHGVHLSDEGVGE